MNNIQPKHYQQGKIDVLKALSLMFPKSWFRGFCVGNVIKYIIRYLDKNGKEDLKKAMYYLNYLTKWEDYK